MVMAFAARPYYIVSPPYTEKSAGVKTLHVVCDLLNKRGYPAYIVLHPDLRGYKHYEPTGVSSKLKAPLLTKAVHDAHIKSGVLPIVVYPDNIPGNPLRAPVAVRYALYYPGKYAGSKKRFKEPVWAFTHAIADTIPDCTGVLSFPVADAREFTCDPAKKEAQLELYYAEKYTNVHGGIVPLSVLGKAFPITKVIPREVLVNMLKKASCVHVFEDTAIIYEALLAGCSVVMHVNEHFTGIAASLETGYAGIARADTPEERRHARESLAEYAKIYKRWQDFSLCQLDGFIQTTQHLYPANFPVQFPRHKPTLRARAGLFFTHALHKLVKLCR